MPQAGSRMVVLQRSSRKSLTSFLASGSCPPFASVTAAAWTLDHCSRRGSTIVGRTSRSTYARGVKWAPNLCRSFLSRARSRSVPKIAGSTSRHCFRPESISRPICSSVKGSAVPWSNRPPLKRSTDA